VDAEGRDALLHEEEVAHHPGGLVKHAGAHQLPREPRVPDFVFRIKTRPDMVSGAKVDYP